MLGLGLACTSGDPADLVPAVSFDELVADCGDVTTPHTRCLAAWGGPDAVIGEACATTTGTALGLDWDSFGEVPHEFEAATSTAELLVSGVLAVAGASGVTVGALVADVGMPDSLAAELVRKQQSAGIDADADAGQLWYQHLATTIHTTISAPELGDSGARMSFADGTVSVEDFGEAQDIPTPPTAVLDVAGSLVHEASHAYADPHIWCPGEHSGRSCDADAEGTWGAGSWWYYTWLQANLDHLDQWTCDDAVSGLLADCMMIIEGDDYAACAYLDTNICDPEARVANEDWDCASD